MISINKIKTAGRDARSLGDGWEPTSSGQDFESLVMCVSRFPWSPIQWHGGVRKQANFGRARWIALDFDDGALTLAQACNVFQDAVHVIGTTKSHNQPKGGVICDRFRVLLKLEDEVTDLATYRATVRFFASKYGSDPQCVDGARFFWPCVEIASTSDDGYFQEIISPAPGQTSERTKAYRAAGILSPWAQATLRGVIPQGERNTACWRLGNDLARAGYAFDEAIELVIASNTYKGQVAPDLAQEIQDAVGRGWKRGIAEAEDERGI